MEKKELLVTFGKSLIISAVFILFLGFGTYPVAWLTLVMWAIISLIESSQGSDYLLDFGLIIITVLAMLILIKLPSKLIKSWKEWLISVAFQLAIYVICFVLALIPVVPFTFMPLVPFFTLLIGRVNMLIYFIFFLNEMLAIQAIGICLKQKKKQRKKERADTPSFKFRWK